MEHIFFLRLHLSELISSCFMVLGALLVWTFIQRKDHVFAQRWQRKLVAGGLMFAVMFIGMMVGLGLEEGHSWGTPATAAALAMEHPWRVFTNDVNLLFIGLLYVIFQLMGAILALCIYIVFVWAYNFAKGRKKHECIYIKELFVFDTSPALNSFFKDAIGALIIAFTIIGASSFATIPTGFPVSDAQVFAAAFAVGVAFCLVISVFGVRGVLVQNPFAWAMAFVLKFLSAFFLDRRAITWKAIGREFIAPIAVFGVAAVSGLLTAGILSLPAEKGVK